MRTLPKYACRLAPALVGTFVAAVLTGCGSGNFEPVNVPAATTASPAGPSGRAMGGQSPIASTSLQLYAVNLTAQRGVSKAIFASPIYSNQNGEFTFPTFTCPTGALVYLVATGGNAGDGTNAAISEMAGLGLCSNLNASTFVSLNEVTTVASVYALAPFMSDYLHIGAASTNLAGITNAFANINSLVNVATGTSPGASAPANAAIPSAELYSLANAIATCINSDGTMPCTALFALATGTAPTETIGSALNIAQHPGNSVLALYSLPTGAVPFQPHLNNPPADWTVSINLTGSALSAPYGIAIDSAGNAWVTNESGFSVTEFNPQGNALSGTNGFGNPYVAGAQGLTVDPAGHVWIANTGGNSILELNSSGGFVSSTGGFKPSGISGPIDIAADARNNIWVANFLGNSVLELNSSGVLTNSLTASSTLSRPDAVAIDGNGGVWVSNSGAGTLTRFDKNANLVSTGNGYTDNALQAPAFVALDPSNNAWVAGDGGSELSGISSAGTAISASPIYSSLLRPTGVAIDGSGTIWVASSTSTGYLSEFAPVTGAPISGSQQLGVLAAPVEIAIDASGNLWSANSGDNSVTLFIGLAVPVQTPLVSRTN